MSSQDPNLVTSSLSQRVLVDGLIFSVEIYRLERDESWTLEIVDHDGTSHVWDDRFSSDRDAKTAALQAIDTEGARAFIRGDNVIPFDTSSGPTFR